LLRARFELGKGHGSQFAGVSRQDQQVRQPVHRHCGIVHRIREIDGQGVTARPDDRQRNGDREMAKAVDQGRVAAVVHARRAPRGGPMHFQREFVRLRPDIQLAVVLHAHLLLVTGWRYPRLRASSNPRT